ncbi:MAG: M56 family metallopeptidase [Saprospiraceae bacterium]|nr:M56 family metallopeptidase [Saprospiraceae bacterium]
MVSQFLSSDISYALAWTLVHSLWQLSVIALALKLVLHIFKKQSSSIKYCISLGALGVALITTLVTFSLYIIDAPQVVVLASEGGLSSSIINSSRLLPSLDFTNKYIPVIVNAWLIGSLLFLIRFSGAYLYLRYIIKQSSLESPILLNGLRALKKKYNIHRNVIIRESVRISTPMVMGYVKPVILFPLGLANQLSMQEVEAILAHELAHIKRHDFLFNLIQSLAEIVFYYHPAIWYISSKIRNERENCCDDMAIEMTGNSISYAKTLVKLQDIEHKALVPALAFSGNKREFSHRIFRILNLPVNTSNMKQKFLAFLLVFTTVFAFAKNANKPIEENTDRQYDLYIIEDCPKDVEEIPYYLDTIPERKSFHITKKTNEEELELKMENGEITSLKINGEEIPENEFEEHEDIIIELSPSQDRDIITVFPDCDKEMGNIFFRDKDWAATINIDSMMSLEKKHIDKLRGLHKNNIFHFDSNHANAFIFDDDDDVVVDLKREIEDMYEDIIIELGDNEDARVIELEIRDRLNDLHEDIIIDLDDLEDEIVIRLDSAKDLFPNGIHTERFFSDDDNNFSFEFDNQFKFKEKQKMHEKMKRMHERESARNKFFKENNDLYFFDKRPRTPADVLTDNLLEDRLIQSDKTYKLELSGKHMKINGEKQPSNIWEKYKEIYEEETGMEMTKKSKIEVEISPKESKSLFYRGSI